MTMRRFEFRDLAENHKKFWEVSDPAGQGRGWIVTCRWGRIGSGGQERTFFFDRYDAAEKFRCDKIDEKKSKGYLSPWPMASGSPSPVIFRHAPAPPPDPADPFSLPFDQENT